MPKVNWTNPLDTPLHEVNAITFGGLRIITDGQVLENEQQPIGGIIPR